MSTPEKLYGIHSVRALLQRAPKRVYRLWLARARQEVLVRTRYLGCHVALPHARCSASGCSGVA